MKTRNRRTKQIAFALAVAFAALLTMLDARRVNAQEEDHHHQVVVGFSSGQTARLIALNSGEETGIILEWKFLDSQGRVLAQSTEGQLIPPGQMRFFDLNADELNAQRDSFGRIQVLALARGNSNQTNLHVSLEIFDNATGKTAVYFPTKTVKAPLLNQYNWGWSPSTLQYGDIKMQPIPPGSQK